MCCGGVISAVEVLVVQLSAGICCIGIDCIGIVGIDCIGICCMGIDCIAGMAGAGT